MAEPAQQPPQATGDHSAGIVIDNNLRGRVDADAAEVAEVPLEPTLDEGIVRVGKGQAQIALGAAAAGRKEVVGQGAEAGAAGEGETAR